MSASFPSNQPALATPRAIHPTNSFLQSSSLEITAKEHQALAQVAADIPHGTLVNLAYLAGENDDVRAQAAEQIRACGLEPVAHLSARRIASENGLRRYMSALRERAQISQLLIIGGDPAQAAGPYRDALALIQQVDWIEYGIRQISIAGYPEGHPKIAEADLWHALRQKREAISRQGLACEITTQFGFDAEPILRWLERLRERGITTPVRIGVAGPARISTLLRYATACGVSTSASMFKKYGMSLTRLLDSAGPDALLEDLQTRLDPARHGETRLHVYPFGGLDKTVQWLRQRQAF